MTINRKTETHTQFIVTLEFMERNVFAQAILSARVKEFWQLVPSPKS